MALFDLLGRRWSLRVIWELRDGSLTFRELQARCEDMSSSVLNQRLRELRDANIVTFAQGRGYSLGEQGHALLTALAPLSTWAGQWGRSLEAEKTTRSGRARS
jgi:DNA-binding HxlR family transcriptional regulator